MKVRICSGGMNMINYKPKHGDMEMWMICEAIGSNHELIDKMKKNDDGSYSIVFSVGGVELDFKRVAQRVDEEITSLVKNKAQSLLDEQYGNLVSEIYEIQERIENQKEKLFQYDWENNL